MAETNRTREDSAANMRDESERLRAARRESNSADPMPSLDELAALYGWGSREVQDAYDYRNAEVPNE